MINLIIVFGFDFAEPLILVGPILFNSIKLNLTMPCFIFIPLICLLIISFAKLKINFQFFFFDFHDSTVGSAFVSKFTDIVGRFESDWWPGLALLNSNFCVFMGTIALCW